MRGVTTADRVRAFLVALGKAARRPATVYLVGGASAVVEGWRESTVDIDLRIEPELDELYRAVAELKNELNINVELASPDQFIPVADGWQERSPFVTSEGRLTIRHFDFVAQALAKISRGHDQDRGDVTAMLARGLVTRAQIADAFELVVPELYRYPALDPATFAASVAEVVGES